MSDEITTLIIAPSTGYITAGDLQGNILVEYDPQTKSCIDRDGNEIECPSEIRAYTQDKTLGWMIAVIALIVLVAVVSAFYFNK